MTVMRARIGRRIVAWEPVSAEQAGTTYYSNDFGSGLPAAADANISLRTGGNWDGNNAMRFLLPNPMETGDAGLPQWDVFDEGVEPATIWVGFPTYFGPDWDAAFEGVGGTQKPFIPTRSNGVSGERAILHIRESTTGAGASVDYRQLFFDHNITRNALQIGPWRRQVSSGDVNTSTNVITEGTHYRTTGDRVTYSEGTSAISPLADGQDYYVIADDADSFRLAETYSDAIAGTAINLTSAGSGTHEFEYNHAFILGGNLGKWFWHEFECNITDRVLSWYVTASDGVMNKVQPNVGTMVFANDGSSPTYQSVACNRLLLEQFRMTGAGTTPGNFWSYLQMGYYDGYTPSAGSWIDIGGPFVVADNRDAVAPPDGFVS